MIVAGIGYSSRASMSAIVEAVNATLAHYGLRRDEVDRLATVASKHGDDCIQDVAGLLGLPVEFVEEERVLAVESGLITDSAFSRRHAGTPSASEAAAMAAAGTGSKLLGPRLTFSGVTCAIAAGGAEG